MPAMDSWYKKHKKRRFREGYVLQFTRNHVYPAKFAIGIIVDLVVID